MNLEVIYEKIGYDFYQVLGEGRFKTPKNYLSRQPIIDQFTRTNRLALYLVGTPDQFREAGFSSADATPAEQRITNESLRIMSSFVSGYQDFEHGRARSPEGGTLTFLEYLETTHRPPESLLTPEGREVPLKGLMALLAVGRVIADTDIIGGSGGNAGFIWVRDPAGEIIAAQAVKIDPGMAFNFGEEDESNWAANTYHRRRVGTTLTDIKDLQIAQQYGSITVHWEAMTSAQKTEFLLTFYHASRAVHSDELVRYLFHRDGCFDRGETEQNPEVVANQFQQRLISWLKIQNQIYGKEMITNKEFYLAFIRSDLKNYKLIDSPNEELLLDREFLLQWMEELQQSLGALRQKHGEEPHPDAADNLLFIGQIYSYLKEYARAIDYFQKSLKIFRELDRDEANVNTASILLLVGRSHFDLGECDKAIEYFQQSLAVLKQLTSSLEVQEIIGYVFFITGVSYYVSNKFESGLEYSEQALAALRQCYPDQPNVKVATSLQSMGYGYSKLRRDREAVESYQESLAIFRQLEGDRPSKSVATLLKGLGEAYDQLNETAQAIEHYRERLVICRQLSNNRPSIDVANTLATLGACYTLSEEYQPAIEYLEQAIAIYEAIGGDLLYSEVLADTFTILAGCHLSRGANAQVAESLERELVIRRRISGDQPNERVAQLLISLGGCYALQLNETARGVEHLHESLGIYRTLDTATPHRSEIALNLSMLALLYSNLEQGDRSIEYSQQSLSIYREIHNGRPHDEIAKSLYFLGKEFRSMEQYPRAIESLQEALRIQRELDNNRPTLQTARTLEALGFNYYESGNNRAATEHFEEALRIKIILQGADHPETISTRRALEKSQSGWCTLQ